MEVTHQPVRFPQRECILFSNTYVTTFDGLTYGPFMSDCTFKFVSLAYMEMSVTFSPHLSAFDQNAFHQFQIAVNSRVFTVTRNHSVIYVDHAHVSSYYEKKVYWYEHAISINYNILQIEHSDYNIKFCLLTHSLSITLLRELRPPHGLCGNADNDPHNDLTYEEKNYTSEIDQFLFFMQKGDICQSDLRQKWNCPEGEAVCNIMKTWYFEDCFKVLDYQEYYDVCVDETCLCSSDLHPNCHCEVLTILSRQCAKVGHPVRDWRTASMCPNIPCRPSSNLHYTENAPGCSPTCGQSVNDQCHTLSGEGCRCDHDKVWSKYNQDCREIDTCPCLLGQMVVSPQDEKKIDCNTCYCLNGTWNCTSDICYGQAIIHGSGHWKTFDHMWYQFQGACEYTFIKFDDGTFNVDVVTDGQCINSKYCVSEVKVTFKTSAGITISLNLRGDSKVSMSHSPLPIPFSFDSFTVQRLSSMYIMIHIHEFDIALLWSHEILKVVMPKKYRDTNMYGMAGNYNGLTTDELLQSNGIIAQTVTAFGNSYKARSPCDDETPITPDSCERSGDVQTIRSTCKRIYDIFEECASMLDEEAFSARCVKDGCDCTVNFMECICESISIYAAMCAAESMPGNDWRKKLGCPKIVCPTSMVYLEYDTRCNKTCKSLFYPENCGPHTLVEGCNCADGEYLNEKGECVTKNQCECYYEEDKSLPAGTGVRINQHHYCLCRDASVECFPKDEPMQNETCPNPDMIYKNCETGTGVECAATCDNYRRNTTCDHSDCIPGCVCPDGFVKFGLSCLRKEDCPCEHQGRYFLKDTEIQQECWNCVCDEGFWNCTATEDCYGSCIISGGSTINTFDDNLYYGFVTNCEMLLMRDGCNPGESDKIKVTFTNYPCPGSEAEIIPLSVCGMKMIVLLDGIEYVFNDEKLESNHSVTSHEVIAPEHMFEKSGLFTVIRSKSGIVVAVGKGFRVMIKLSTTYKGNVCGLCGNFDGNAHNDLSSNGLQTGAPRTHLLSQRIDYGCVVASNNSHDENACEVFKNRETRAQQSCEKLFYAPFDVCHTMVSPKPYFENCKRETCSCESGSDCECYCTAVAAYAQACGEKGVRIHWRDTELCPLMCEALGYYSYEPCSSNCEKLCCHTDCVGCYEGCYPSCPPDELFRVDWEACVKKENCGCPETTIMSTASPASSAPSGATTTTAPPGVGGSTAFSAASAPSGATTTTAPTGAGGSTAALATSAASGATNTIAPPGAGGSTAALTSTASSGNRSSTVTETTQQNATVHSPLGAAEIVLDTSAIAGEACQVKYVVHNFTIWSENDNMTCQTGPVTVGYCWGKCAEKFIVQDRVFTGQCTCCIQAEFEYLYHHTDCPSGTKIKVSHPKTCQCVSGACGDSTL